MVVRKKILCALSIAIRARKCLFVYVAYAVREAFEKSSLNKLPCVNCNWNIMQFYGLFIAFALGKIDVSVRPPTIYLCARYISFACMSHGH